MQNLGIAVQTIIKTYSANVKYVTNTSIEKNERKTSEKKKKYR